MKSFLHSLIKHPKINSGVLNCQVQHNYATKAVVKLKNKAAKDLSNDETGKHPHVVTQTCILNTCKSQVCPTLCDTPDKMRVDGHNSHKPVAGRISRYIADTDANNNNQDQYFTKANKKIEITEQEKQAYSKDIKPMPKHDPYLKQHAEKYED